MSRAMRWLRRLWLGTDEPAVLETGAPFVCLPARQAPDDQ